MATDHTMMAMAKPRIRRWRIKIGIKPAFIGLQQFVKAQKNPYHRLIRYYFCPVTSVGLKNLVCSAISTSKVLVK